MFSFTTETIINAASKFATIAADTDAGIEAGKKALWIKKLNKFIVGGTDDAVVNSVIFKRPATAATLAASKVTIPTVVVGTLYRVGVQITSNGYQDGMFARDRVTYGKPFYIELLATATSSTTAATALAAAWNKTYASYDHFVTATSSGADLTFTANDNPFISFKTITFETLDATTNSAIDAGLIVTVVTSGKPSFGDYTYLLKNSRLPTLDNYRPFGLNQEELPITGDTYNQYTIIYETKRENGGQAVVGQTGTSKTTHVLWVNSTLVGAPSADNEVTPGTGFEGALSASGLTITAV